MQRGKNHYLFTYLKNCVLRQDGSSYRQYYILSMLRQHLRKPVLPVPQFSRTIGRFFRLIGRFFGGHGLRFFGPFRNLPPVLGYRGFGRDPMVS